MGHKDKGCAGLGHHFLEEQPLPVKKREKELVMGRIQSSSNKSAQSSVCLSSHPEPQSTSQIY